MTQHDTTILRIDTEDDERWIISLLTRKMTKDGEMVPKNPEDGERWLSNVYRQQVYHPKEK